MDQSPPDQRAPAPVAPVAPEPPWWLLLLIVGALVGVFFAGYVWSSDRPSVNFRYIVRDLRGNDAVGVATGNSGALLSVRGRLTKLKIHSVGGKGGALIALPIADCATVTVSGPAKCHAGTVGLDSTVVRVVWSQPVEFCTALTAVSPSFSGSPTFPKGLHVAAPLSEKQPRSAPAEDCRPTPGPPVVCFPVPLGRLTIEPGGGATSVWTFRPGTTTTCAHGIKLRVSSLETNSTVSFDVPMVEASLRLIALGSGGVFPSSHGIFLSSEGSVAIDPGDSLHVPHAHDLCVVLVLRGGTPAGETPEESACNSALGNGLDVWSDSAGSAMRASTGEQLLHTNYQQDPALWLALLGAYLTVVVTFIPTLGRRAYVGLWRGQAHVRAKKRPRPARRRRKEGPS